jgi:hypothetical protein
MIDSRTAAHTAFYDALAEDARVTALADVWGHAEEGTEPTEQGAGADRPRQRVQPGGKDGGLDEVTIEVWHTSASPT